MNKKFVSLFLAIIVLNFPVTIYSQKSVAREWNDVLLEAIREDFARPTVHARNLFHTSVAMWDAWAAYDQVAETYLLGKIINGFSSNFDGVNLQIDREASRNEAISFAAYRLLSHRFANSPGAESSLTRFDSLLTLLGYDGSITSVDYIAGGPAELGNYIAQTLIEFGLQDDSNEQNGYDNLFYETINSPLQPDTSGNPNIADPNRWQPLALDILIDQSGNVIPDGITKFLSPEWGTVTPFALSGEDLTVYERDGQQYWLYHDPGDPPYIDTLNGEGMTEEYQWGFALVAVWSSLLDPSDNVMIDISPASIGNTDITDFPQSVLDLRNFYNLTEGGDPGTGYAENPYTGLPYEPQMVPRGDYARVLAEFWADGPDSETPPGHWFTILNYVNDNEIFEKRFGGEGEILDELEWDVKAYFTLGGAVHDAAIAVWGIKGWYDYIRPISAIRYMADRGQSSNSLLPRYSALGIPLIDGLIELVQEGDALAGESGENIDKIKLYSWHGPGFIGDPAVDVAGVGWILAENWWPYQRPSFVTPPFAGYISGHSTYSRAAAEVMTLITGDAFFPGGMGIFNCPKNEFLVFEEGPSIDLTLQWATYRDASDQCSLSRIFGGIHPPADDIPGRLIGETIGIEAVQLAKKYFTGTITAVQKFDDNLPTGYVLHSNFPNPFNPVTTLKYSLPVPGKVVLTIFDLRGREIERLVNNELSAGVHTIVWDASNVASGVYFYRLQANDFTQTKKMALLK